MIESATNSEIVMKTDFGNLIVPAVPMNWDRIDFGAYRIGDEDDENRHVDFEVHRISLPEDNPKVKMEEIR